MSEHPFHHAAVAVIDGLTATGIGILGIGFFIESYVAGITLYAIGYGFVAGVALVTALGAYTDALEEGSRAYQLYHQTDDEDLVAPEAHEAYLDGEIDEDTLEERLDEELGDTERDREKRVVER